MPTSSTYSRARLRISRLSSHLNGPKPRGSSRLRNMLWATERHGTRARSWKTVSIPSERAWSTERIVPRCRRRTSGPSRSQEAGQDLDQRRLAGAVVADERQAPRPCRGATRRPERDHRAEALRDVLGRRRSGAALAGLAHQLPEVPEPCHLHVRTIDARIARPEDEVELVRVDAEDVEAVRSTIRTATPRNAPSTVPDPPISEVPPMTAPATARNMMSGPPCSGWIEVMRSSPGSRRSPPGRPPGRSSRS